MARLGRFVVRRRVAVLVATVVAFAVAGVLGGGVAKRLTTGGFQDPRAESTQVQTILNDTFKTDDPNFVLLVTAKHGSVDDPAVAAEGEALTRQLAAEPLIGAGQAVSYWTLGSPPPLRSTTGKQALVLARIQGPSDDLTKRVKTIAPRYVSDDALISVRVGGFGEVFREVSAQIQRDLKTAEGLSLPITLLLLVLVFGSVVAALLPLAVGGVAIVGTFLVLTVIAALTKVSVFSLNLTTGMGLGLGIDYSLFVVSRFREELALGLRPDRAVVRTVETAGRTVLFSALTVAASLAALLVFPLYFLRSFAYAGMGVVVIAALAAVLTLPALLAVLSRRIDTWVLWHRQPKPAGQDLWHRIAMFVMRRPARVAGSVIVVLLLLGAPFLRVHFGLPDDRVLPTSAPGRRVSDQIRRNFTSNEAGALTVVAQGPSRPGDVERFAAVVSSLAGVARVDAASGSYIDGHQVLPAGPASARFVAPGRATTSTWLSVVPSVEPLSAKAEALVKQVRALPASFKVKVGGPSAQLVDSKARLFALLPLAGLIIALVTFTVLFLMTGSVVVPIKAVVLNLLSLTATFGAMVWVFQQGHLSGLLHFTPTGSIDTTTPILMFCVAFGLSMDYEVFLLSRIKEEHDRTGDNISSVAIGLERTGRIVTAAAALLAVVFLIFATSKVTFIKLFGIGLAMAILMDATLIRAALVPAFMRLAGDANWWAPGPLRRFHDRFGFREVPPEPAPAATSEDAQRRELVGSSIGAPQ